MSTLRRAGWIRDTLRWWPISVLIVVVAVAASLVALNARTPMYTATARLAITPLAQFDETFVGTSLIRYAGYPNRTAEAVAAQLGDRAVADAAATALGAGWTGGSVSAAVVLRTADRADGADVVEVSARTPESGRAERLAAAYAQAALSLRGQQIATELDGRIAALAPDVDAHPDDGDASRRLSELRAAHSSGGDPSLRLQDVGRATPVSRLPAALVVVLAAMGGGALAAPTAVVLSRAGRRCAAGSLAHPDRATPAFLLTVRS